MCVYSAYVDSAQKQWPGLNPLPFSPEKPFMPWGPGVPYMPSLVSPPADPRILQEILDIGRRLDRIDKALGLTDCTQEAANKKAFEARLEQLIRDATALQQLNAQNQVNAKQALDGYATSGNIQLAATQSGLQAGVSLGHGDAAFAKRIQST